jgi:tRNA threonylcarbamoyladenosine biosynthesis protein TsaB
MPARLATADEAIEEIRTRFESLNGPLACAGTAAALAAQKWRELGHDAIETAIRSPDALWVGRLALDEPEPATVPRPLYLRPPDARLPAAGS